MKTFDCRIANLKAIMTWGIVFLHSGAAFNYVVYERTTGVVIYEKISSVLWGSLGAFFLISGYFLRQYTTPDDYKILMRQKVKSLLFPFLIWNVLYLAAYLIGAKFSPATAQRCEAMGLDSVWGITNSLFGITANPADGPMWYIRNLILYTGLQFFWHWGVRKFSIFFTIGLLVTYCFIYKYMPYALGRWLIPYGVIAFSLGYYLNYKKHSLFLLARYPLVSLVLLVVYLQIDRLKCLDFLQKNNLMPLLIIPFWITAAKFLTYPKESWLYKVFTASAFYVYAMHAFVCTAVLRLGVKYIPVNSWSWCNAVLLFFVGGGILIMASYFFMKLVLPKVLAFLNGGRC